jgi:chemotaxis protein MotB
MARGHGRRRHGDHDGEHEENHERWLVSYADMMTLLFALFMVLFSISSVNTSKFEALQKALQDAFSGRVLSGGKAIMETGSDNQPKQATAEPPLASLQPLNAVARVDAVNAEQQKAQAAKASQEQEQFQALKRRIDALARKQGLQGRVSVMIRRRGLVIQLLTDKVFFDSGQAAIKPEAERLVNKIAVILRDEHDHPVVVEGHTDSVPTSGGRYSSNFDLSGARAAAVVDDFIRNGVLERRLSLTGYADKEPIATNTTAVGRAKNRRVEVVLNRIHNSS